MRQFVILIEGRVGVSGDTKVMIKALLNFNVAFWTKVAIFETLPLLLYNLKFLVIL